LSVYAETGSVKTPKLFNIESFNQVHHMVSEVEATLKAEVHPFHVLRSALPGCVCSSCCVVSFLSHFSTSNIEKVAAREV